MRLDAHFDMLPDRAFEKRGFGFSRPATLEGGKGGGATTVQADPNVGIAQKEMAALARQQYDDFKNTIWPELQKQYATQTASATRLSDQQYALNEKNAGYADDYMARMKEKFYPMQDKVIQEANDYNTQGNFERQAALSMGDVNTQFDTARKNNNMQMMAYGINPNSGQFASQNNANNVLQAATGAAAATKARQAAEQLGWAKRMDAIGLGSGLPGNQATSTGLALSAGNSSLAAGQTNMGNLSAMNANLNSATNTSMNGWNGVGNLGVGITNAQVSAQNAANQANATQSAGWGSALGALGGAALYKYSDVRMKENIQEIGKTNGGVTLYSFEYKKEFKDKAGYGRHIGVMAHDVPHATSLDRDGFLMVDYSKVN